MHFNEVPSCDDTFELQNITTDRTPHGVCAILISVHVITTTHHFDLPPSLQSLFDLATKPCSVAFDAYRDESYVNGGEDYLTFSGCTVNIGNGMCPKTGEFTCPDPGLYLILATCCTFDMKKCLVSIRKNGKDAANIFDQDGDTNKVWTG